MINPFKLSCNRIYLTIGIAVFTIVQVLGHIIGLTFMVYWRDCSIGRPLSSFLVFLFGTERCETGTYKDAITGEGDPVITTNFDSIILTYYILDAIWVITSAGLLMGAMCRLIDIWALIFYLPWAVVNGIVLLYDIFSATYFAVNLPEHMNIFNWLNVMGITNTISDLNDQLSEVNDAHDVVTGIVLVLMTFVSSRGVVIWLINVILLVIIVKIAISEYKIKQNSQNEPRTRRIPPERTNSERIRNWYKYYDKNGNSQDSENQNNIIEARQPGRVKMTTLTIINYQTFNNAAYASDSDDNISYKEIKPKSFKENFPTIIVTDITSNTSTPSDPQPRQFPCSSSDDDTIVKRLDDQDVDGDHCRDSRDTNLRNIPLNGSGDDIPRIIINDVRSDTLTQSNTEHNPISWFYNEDDVTNDKPNDIEINDENQCQMISIIKLKNTSIEESMEFEKDVSKV